MHIPRGGARIGELASIAPGGPGGPDQWAARKERSAICSLSPRVRLCTLPLFHYFFMSFFYPKKYFLKVKKIDISNMQILESSRPIMKCEHFLSLILHFQVDISTQKQALGNISKFTASVCARVRVWVCVCGCEWKPKHVCVCRCVRVFCVRVCVKCVRDLTVDFPFYSVCALFFLFLFLFFFLFWRVGQRFVIIISF